MATPNKTNAQTEAILANPFISVPIVFSVSQNGKDLHLYSTFLNSSRNMANEEKICGSIVANPNVIGASAQVLAVPGKVNGHDSQRLLIKTMGPQAPAQQKTLDFYPIFAASSEAQKNPVDGTNLYMKITDGLLPPGVDANTADSLPGIPLIVGPDSAVIGTMDKESLVTLNKLGVDWGGLLDIAKKVLPVVAKAGYQIYQELSAPPKSESSRSKKDSDNVGFFFDAILSIAKIAVPIAGSLLAAL